MFFTLNVGLPPTQDKTKLRSNTKAMRFICAMMVSFLTIYNTTSFEFSVDQKFQLPEEVTAIVLEFEDKIEIIEAAGNTIVVETSLTSSHQSVLEYEESKHQFKIIPSYDFSDRHQKIILKPKKINTNIFIDGQMHETIKKYKIYVPSHLQIFQQ